MTTDELAFACPSCGECLKAEARDAGRRAFCPFCQAEVLIPFLQLGEEHREVALKALQDKVGRMDPGKGAERRLYVRFATEGVRIQLGDGTTCRAANLSRGGMALAFESEVGLPELGASVPLTILTPHGADLYVKGIPVWRREGGPHPAGGSSVGGAERTRERSELLVGFEFVEPEPDVSEALLRLERMVVDGAAAWRQAKQKKQGP
jgi:hypothetical protein